MMYAFQLISMDGEILESFQTAEQRWQTGDTVIGPPGPCLPRKLGIDPQTTAVSPSFGIYVLEKALTRGYAGLGGRRPARASREERIAVQDAQ